MRWTPIEDASDAFERPAWAIEKMIGEGKLERRVEPDGRVFVRRPPTLAEIAEELAPFLPDEAVPVVATVVAAEEPEAQEAAPVFTSRAEILPEASREELMLRAVWKLLERHHEQLREIRRLQTQPPLLLPAPVAAPPPPARARGSFVAVALGVVLALGGLGLAFLAQDALAQERERGERALDHAEWLARELGQERTAFVGSSVSVVGSSATTLAAGFRR
jgi:hypothetical protein